MKRKASTLARPKFVIESADRKRLRRVCPMKRPIPTNRTATMMRTSGNCKILFIIYSLSDSLDLLSPAPGPFHQPEYHDHNGDEDHGRHECCFDWLERGGIENPPVDRLTQRAKACHQP